MEVKGTDHCGAYHLRVPFVPISCDDPSDVLLKKRGGYTQVGRLLLCWEAGMRMRVLYGYRSRVGHGYTCL